MSQKLLSLIKSQMTISALLSGARSTLSTKPHHHSADATVDYRIVNIAQKSLYEWGSGFSGAIN